MRYRALQLHHKHFAKQLSKLPNLSHIKANTATPVSVLRELFAIDTSIMSSLQFWAFVAEHNWLNNTDKNAIFPQDNEFLDSLLDAKFNVKKGATVTFPYESFALFFPQDYKINGVAATSCLVEFTTFRKRHANASEMHVILTGNEPAGVVLDGDVDKDDYVINCFYPDLYNADQLNNMVVPIKKLMDLLEADDPNAYAKALGSLEDKFNEDDALKIVTLDNDEIAYQQKLLKIIVSMGIYYSAVGSDALYLGTPDAPINKLTDKNTTIKPSVLKRKGGTEEKVVGVHKRKMHFRTLMHDKYYKGEHKDKPRGSRWVFIDEQSVVVKTKNETMY